MKTMLIANPKTCGHRNGTKRKTHGVATTPSGQTGSPASLCLAMINEERDRRDDERRQQEDFFRIKIFCGIGGALAMERIYYRFPTCCSMEAPLAFLGLTH